jgi:carbonic anhydrase
MISPDEALSILREGNRRFLMDDSPIDDEPLSHDRRLEIARNQQPMAVLVSCSDSRVPPELLFGRGLGELFIVRNAGNTVDTVAMGSIEYAVHVLGVRLIVVLGHQRCGAVSAALSVVERDEVFPGSVGKMVEPIIPAVLLAKKKCSACEESEQVWDQAVRENIRRVVESLKTSQPILAEKVQSEGLKIVGAYYRLDDGMVEFLD